MRTVKYSLEVYGSNGEALFTVEAATPFGAISKGDKIHVDNVTGFAASGERGTVSQIEHFFYAVSEDTFAQKTMVTLG